MNFCSCFSSSKYECLPRVQIGQLVLQRVVIIILRVLGLFVNLQVAIELQDRAGYAEVIRRSACAFTSTIVWSKTAGTICDATKRRQMSW